MPDPNCQYLNVFGYSVMLFVLYSEIFEILLLFGLRDIVVLTGLWKGVCFKDSDACHT